MNDLVSVVIPCYNCEQYVESAVKSIMIQTYDNLEIICINDGSTDRTLEILEKLKLEDQRIVVINNEVNLKLIKTLNKGVEMANGKYLARMDADDLSVFDRIERQMRLMKQDETIDVVGIVPMMIDKYSKKIGRATEYYCTIDFSLKFIALFNTPLAHPSIMIKTSVLRSFLYIDTPDVYFVEDYDLWVRLLLSGKKVCVIDQHLFNYRINPSGVSLSNRVVQTANHINIAKRILAEAGFGWVPERHIGIICRLHIPQSVFEVSAAIDNFKLIRKNYIASVIGSSEIAKKEIDTWFEQRKLFIIFNAIKMGRGANKVLSFFLIFYCLNSLFKKITYENIGTRIRLIMSKKIDK